MAKLFEANLLNDVDTVYAQTKTYIAGRAFEQVVNGKDCVGPRLSNFIDVFSDTTGAGSIAPSGVIAMGNNRFILLGAYATGLVTAVLYDFNLTSAPYGEYAYVGRLVLQLPNTAATTHTFRALALDDTGPTWKLFIATTGSVTANGGLFMVNGISAADFVPLAPATIPMATGSNQKATYFLQDPAMMGSLHVMTASSGIVLDTESKIVYLHNGTAAVNQWHSFDYSATPNVTSSTVTISIATPGVVSHAGHPFLLNDRITFSTTGALPTGIVAGTVYFVRNPGANTYELSATSGGAAINTTGTQSGVHTVRRAFGQTNSLPYTATGNITTLGGVLLLTNAAKIYIPQSGANTGQKCATFATTTNFYEGRLSELTSGAVSWPSLRTINDAGAPGTLIPTTVTHAQMDEDTQDLVFAASSSKFTLKDFVDNAVKGLFGMQINDSYEAVPEETRAFGLNTINGLARKDGWVFAASAVAGQRGIMFIDLKSDTQYDFSYVTTPVLDLQKGKIVDIRTMEALFDETGTLSFFYRTSGFGSAAGGWVSIPTAEDLQPLSIVADQIQFKLAFDLANENIPTPAQPVELHIDAVLPGEMSEYWEVDHGATVSTSPTRTGYRLKKAYATTVPTLYHRWFDDITRAELGVANTSANAANFNYSTDGGNTWLPLGTVPNTVGTRLRYTHTTPPGVDIVSSVREA